MIKSYLFLIAVAVLLTGMYAMPQAQASHSTNMVFVKDYSQTKYKSPYGKVNFKTYFYKAENDRSNTYDWYEVYIQHQSIPGVYYYRDVNSGYKTSYASTLYQGKTGTILWDYDPTGTISSASVSVSLTFSMYSSVGGSWTYSTPSVYAYDYSDFGYEKAKWKHVVAYTSSTAAVSTFTAKPGAMFRVADDAYVKVMMDNTTCFKQNTYSYCLGYLYDYMSARMLGDPT